MLAIIRLYAPPLAAAGILGIAIGCSLGRRSAVPATFAAALALGAAPCAADPARQLDSLLALARQAASGDYREVIDLSQAAEERFRPGQDIAPIEKDLLSRGFKRSRGQGIDAPFVYFTKTTMWGFSIRHFALHREMRIVLFTTDDIKLKRAQAYLVRGALP
jgi:hypothetical protein